MLACVVLWTVMFGLAYGFFKIQNAVMKGGIRPPAEIEIAGMDIPEMGALAYPEFLEVDVIDVATGGGSPTKQEPVKEPV